jgi:beta-glucanase (GH16 family)
MKNISRESLLPSRRARFAGIAAVALAFSAMLTESAAHARKPVPPPMPTAQGSFTDHLSAYNSDIWMMADGWRSGAPFACGWNADNVSFDGNHMSLVLDDTPITGDAYSSGQYGTTGYYGYGCYEASFKPVPASGVVSSFFTFAALSDNGGNGQHNEIDIEFLGYDTSQLQANFWTNDDAYDHGHEQLIPLNFDASSAFHTYGFKWTSTGIGWWVDGVMVHLVNDASADPTPKATESLQKIMTNVWPVDSTAAIWAGTFVYPGTPLHGDYDWVRYTEGETCSMSQPAPLPPTQSGDPSVMHVATITLSLGSQNRQAGALVTIANGLGQPVPGVTVQGLWSGLTTGGDTSSVTGTDGSAIFYSARSSSHGTFTFCVKSLTRSGMTYGATANAETCDGITK